MPQVAQPPRAGARRTRVLAAGLATALLLVLAVAGAALGALVLSNRAVDEAQQRSAADITRSWATPVPTGDAVPSGALGLLRVPRFGADYVRVIGEGTTDEVLDSGEVGHYAGTAGPGGIGNLALAGHREARGAAMLHITALRKGDEIVVETRTRTYVYRVTGSRRVAVTAVDAIAPVPWRPAATPTKRLITLQSCTPPLLDTWRYVVWGELVSATPRR